MWQAWTVKEDGSPHHLERDHATDEDRKYWLCRNCWDKFWYWTEAVRHLEENQTLMTAAAV